MATAGYSGTPLPRKLGIKPGMNVGLLGAPSDFERTLGPVPDGVTLRRRAQGSLDIAILFVRRGKDLEARFPAADKALAPGGKLWIAWPKQGSPLAGDINRDDVRAFGLARKWVDFKVCAVDEIWSGLCFSRVKK